ncbi:MAG TPA: cytochrome-c peroxidase [Polyangia bacterium]|nr:cytochrome-c peroxidase [Polyangia bacterium]
MTRSLARSLLVLGIGGFAVGCAPQSTAPDVPLMPPPGGITDSSGAGGLCGGGFGPGGGVAFAATGTAGGFGAPTTPQVGQTHTADSAPPAISGGTLRIMPDGVTAIAADPDRDQVYVVDLAKRSLSFTVALQKGDEPGRVTVDGAGRAHVALRHGGALVTIAPATGTILARRDVCAAPRGVAYDAANDLVHVACADGQLVSLAAAPDGAVTRTVQLDSDLRDVIVEGGRLHVTRFRSAELLTLDATGAVQSRTSPPSFRAAQTRNQQLYTPSVAWRSMALPTGGVVMVHQRGLMDDVMPTAGGYGASVFGNGQCDAIVQTAVTIVEPGKLPQTGPAMAGMVIPADMAVSDDGSRVAIIAAGNATNSESPGGPARLPRVFVTDMSDATDPVIGCTSDGQHGPCLPANGFVSPPPPLDPTTGQPTGNAADIPNTCGTSTDSGSSSDPTVPEVVGQPIAVSFMGTGDVVVQSREPARLSLPGGPPIVLSDVSRSDTGHDLFHANAGSGIACASCHAEGTEDGRTWTFACEGTRRTQSLQVGLAGTEPFHWGGDEKDFPTLVQDVFVGRMSGPSLDMNQIAATLHWIDAQPRRTRTQPADPAAVARGQSLFNDTTHAACSTCHNGPSLTNSQTVDVGTGGKFQVPSLVGIGTRGPFMHDGCAKTLTDRFTVPACGGGDKHGVTSKLSAAEVSDLVAYLNTL